MRQLRNIILPIMTILLMWGCEDSSPQNGLLVVEEVVTPNINLAPYYFSFASGSAADNLPDVTFKLDTTASPSLYVVEINSAAGVAAIVDTNGDFTNGVAEPGGTLEYDDATTLVIGANWMDPSTYNLADNSSISSNGIFYYLRLASYEVVKFEVTKGSTIEYDIRYAIQSNDSTSGSLVSKTIPYTRTEPATFDFNTGAVLDPVEWNMGLVLVPVYFAPFDQIFPTPAVIVNYANDTQVGVLTNAIFDDVDSVPANMNWQSEDAESRPFGYLGAYEVLVYHPDLQKVLVENPDYVYIIDTGDGKFFKMRFVAWEAGIIQFDYAEL